MRGSIVDAEHANFSRYQQKLWSPGFSLKLTRSAYFKYHPILLMMNNEAGRIFHDVTLSDLGQIRHYVRDLVAACGCEAGALDELIVAMDEAVSNIVRHGYKQERGEIKVTVVCGRDVVKVMLHDNSAGFDPMTIPSPDTTLPLEERPFGGLGLHMMRTFCDEVSYRRDAHSGNELTLLKRFEP